MLYPKLFAKDLFGEIWKIFFDHIHEATQLVNTNINVEKITNNRSVNDLPTNEGTKPPPKVWDDSKPLRNKRPYWNVEMRRKHDGT